MVIQPQQQQQPTIEAHIPSGTLDNLDTKIEVDKQPEIVSIKKEASEEKIREEEIPKEEFPKEEITEIEKETPKEEEKRPQSSPKKGFDTSSLKAAFLSGKKFRVDAKGNLIEVQNLDQSDPLARSHGQISDGSGPDYIISKQASLGGPALRIAINRIGDSSVSDSASTFRKRLSRFHDNDHSPFLKSGVPSLFPSRLPSRGSTRGKQIGSNLDGIEGPRDIIAGNWLPENELFDMQTLRVKRLMQQTAALRRGLSFDVFFDGENPDLHDLDVDPLQLAKRHNSMFVHRSPHEFDITEGYMAKRKSHVPSFAQDSGSQRGSVTQRDLEYADETESIPQIDTKIDLSKSPTLDRVDSKSVISTGSLEKKNSQVFTPKTLLDALTQEELVKMRERFKKLSEGSGFKTVEKKPVDLHIKGTDVGTTKEVTPKVQNRASAKINRAISEFKREKFESNALIL